MKKSYLKSWLEKLLVSVELIIIAFFAMTIDSILENPIYDRIAFVLIITLIVNGLVLSKYSKSIIEANK